MAKPSVKLPKLPSAQAFIALAIIFLSFGLIGYMLLMQDHTASDVRDQIKNMTKSKIPLNQTTILLTALEETEKSNQTTFNILLPVFAAWVTAVVAFYFHTQVHNQSQQTINNLSSQIAGQLSDMTIEDLLKYYPDAKTVIIAKLTDPLQDVKDKCQKFFNIAVTDATGKPLGIIYYSSLLSLTNPGQTLGDNFRNIIDPITGKTWSDNGVLNFASLTPRDVVSVAKKKMDDIKPNEPKIRGFVIETGNIVAIINYQMLTQPISNP